MKKIILILIILNLFISILDLKAESKVDSLKTALNRSSEAEDKLELLNQLATELLSKDPEQSIIYAQKALDISSNIDDSASKVTALKNLGIAYYYLGDYKNALDYQYKALDIYTQLDIKSSIAGTYGNIGIIYYQLDEYEKAIEFQLNALTNYREIEDQKGLSNTYNNMGNIFFSQGNLTEAERYYKNSLEFSLALNDEQGLVATYTNLAVISSLSYDYQLSLEYYKAVLELQRDKVDSSQFASTLGNIGNIYNKLSRYNLAIEHYTEAYKIYSTINDSTNIAITLSNMGVVYNNFGNHDQALTHYLKSLEIKEELNEPESVANTLNNIGLIYEKISKHDIALEYFERSLKINEEIGNKSGIAATLGNIGIIHKNLGDYDSALTFYKDSNKLYEEIGDLNGLATSQNNIGLIYARDSDLNSALKECLGSLEIYRQINNKNGIANCSNDVGTIYLRMKNYDEAVKYLTIGLELATSIKAKDLIANSYDSFYELNESRGDYKQALIFFKKFKALQDSIYTSESSFRIAEMQTRFETEKKEKENAIYRLEIESQKLIQVLLFLGLVFVVIIFAVIAYRYHNKIVVNRQLETKINDALIEQKKQQQIIAHQASLSSLGEMAAGIAHEINQPLQNMKFTAESIILEDEECETNDDLRDMLDDIERIRRIIDHIRMFSRNQKDERKRPFDVNKSIENGFRLIRKMYEREIIETVFDLDSTLPNVSGNPFKYEQVVLNLLSNAKDAVVSKRKAGKENYRPKITIRTFMSNDLVTLEVRDNGTGIPAENLQNIFLPFYTNKQVGEGTGLGLSISFGIVKEMNGFIDAESEPGEFSRFFVKIPPTAY